jgi:flavin reductase (DIM6/NTAB) family NADH-FMN oxidoreductase RutF
MSDDPIKEALNRIPYGFYALTSRNEDDVNAMVINWAMQASFSPRLVAIGLQKKAYSHGVISEGGVFAINIFNAGDQEAMMGFTKGRARNPEKMAQANYTLGKETGCPVLDGAAAYLECKLVQMVDVGGDHDILVGEVIGAEILKEGNVDDTLTLPHVGWSYAG